MSSEVIMEPDFLNLPIGEKNYLIRKLFLQDILASITIPDV